MSGQRMPGRTEFSRFFQKRLKALNPEEELIWLSSRIPVDALAAAYPLGIFPWPGEDPDLFPWVTPLHRGILLLEKFHIGKSSRRQMRRQGFSVTMNTAFARVIRTCSRFHQPESWIHPGMQQAYIQAHDQGFAHSVEVWKDDALVGGLYGIDSGHFFSGESMFHHVPNAGKAALSFLVKKRREAGNTLLDIQQLTPHMAAAGAEEWTRERFHREMGLHRF